LKPSERKPSFYTFLVFSPLLLFLGEIVPKSVYQQKVELGTHVIVFPHRAAFFLFPPIIFFSLRLRTYPYGSPGEAKRRKASF
ncbi:MAG: hypothetical protein P8Y40_11645, partial [Desulfobacterales bacterium]